MDVDTKPPAKKVKFAIDYNEAIGKSENFSANFCESHTPDFISQITHHLNCLSLQAVPLKSVKAATCTSSPPSWSTACSSQELKTASTLNKVLPVNPALLKNSFGSCSTPSMQLFPNLTMPVVGLTKQISEAQAVETLIEESSLYDEVVSKNAYAYSNNNDLCDTFPPLKSSHKRPVTYMVPTTIQKQPCKKILTALADTGSDISLIHEQCLPPGIKPKQIESQCVMGLHEAKPYNLQVTLENILCQN